eukprot:CAMPEP_0174945578 /NCGR_PEP_ID=MMETSP1355-20121228/81977_1 /TAXON_ID=464990 /ORGANISM="Hemiselmis tepida, Strain CCMP443" /LENGTH=44 /DNA_ID= /DNA_START= /DNA_END= /DNA_ORIENTATION=
MTVCQHDPSASQLTSQQPNQRLAAPKLKRVNRFPVSKTLHEARP